MPIYKGNTKIVKLYKGSTQIVKRYKGTNLIYSASRLPAEFQEVEYIESSGTQYIDSGFAANSNRNIEIDFQIQTSTSNQTLFGCWNGSSANFALRLTGSSNLYNYRIASSWTATSISGDNNRHYVKLDNINGVLEYDSSQIAISTNSPNCQRNITLFAINSDNIEGYASMKLFSCKMFDNNNILVRDFVPCYRKADNVAGLYDLVNGVFYTNAGTGTFIVGGNV